MHLKSFFDGEVEQTSCHSGRVYMNVQLYNIAVIARADSVFNRQLIGKHHRPGSVRLLMDREICLQYTYVYKHTTSALSGNYRLSLKLLENFEMYILFT